jgi:hypothetical protein
MSLDPFLKSCMDDTHLIHHKGHSLRRLTTFLKDTIYLVFILGRELLNNECLTLSKSLLCVIYLYFNWRIPHIRISTIAHSFLTIIQALETSMSVALLFLDACVITTSKTTTKTSMKTLGMWANDNKSKGSVKD